MSLPQSPGGRSSFLPSFSAFFSSPISAAQSLDCRELARMLAAPVLLDSREGGRTVSGRVAPASGGDEANADKSLSSLCTPSLPVNLYLYCIVRRPRAATGESLNSPPTFYFDRQQPSQPISSESLLGSGGPSSPGLGGSSSARRQQQQQQQRGNLPSPPLSSSHREDPLVNFGQRLMRRISNQGGSSSNSGGGGLPTIASSGAASGGISPSRSAGGGATPVSHQRSTSTSPTTATTAAGRSTGAGGPDESRSSLAPVNDSGASAPI